LRGRWFLVFGTAALGSMAAPAQAAMFDFHFGSLRSEFTYDSGAFEVSVIPTKTSGSVVDQGPLGGVAEFYVNQWATGDFSLSMTITNISVSAPYSADGTGTFTITDADGDVIKGDLSGQWTRWGVANVFAGTLSSVLFVDDPDDGKEFDGHGGSLILSDSGPWVGTIVELSTTGTWFGEGSYVTNSGSVDASVVPMPAGVVLGFLGLAVAGLKLRQLA